MSPAISFTRNPSTKIPVDIETSSLSTADNQLVIVGHMASSGSTATANVPYTVNNYGDSTLALAECITQFGTGSEVGGMVVAAIKASEGTDLDPILFPPIIVIPIAHATTTIAAALNANIALPMPFLVSPYPASDSTNLAALQTFAEAISASDKGANGQFGSFAFAATDEDTSPASAEGVATASPNVMIGWLRDLQGSKANTTQNVAAALAAICASNGIPFNPLNDVVVGGLVAPTSSADYHTDGDAGTVALGLASGLIPLKTSTGGQILISRTVTTSRRDPSQADTAYYDMQDFQGLYYYRKNAYALTKQPRYKRSKAFNQKLLALKSELIHLAKTLEKDPYFITQNVDLLAQLFTVSRPANNRSAAVYAVPLNIVPGFHNKGIAVTGTDMFDLLTVA